MDADEDLHVPDPGLLDVPCLEDLRRAVPVLDDRLHVWSQPLWSRLTAYAISYTLYTVRVW